MYTKFVWDFKIDGVLVYVSNKIKNSQISLTVRDMWLPFTVRNEKCFFSVQNRNQTFINFFKNISIKLIRDVEFRNTFIIRVWMHPEIVFLTANVLVARDNN